MLSEPRAASLSLRRAASLRASDATILAWRDPLDDADDAGAAVRQLLAAAGPDGSRLGPGDLLAVVVPVAADGRPALWTALDAPEDSALGPARVDGTVELAAEENPLLRDLSSLSRPAPGDDRALVKHFRLPLPTSTGTTEVDVRQLVLYWAPSTHRGVRVHGMPPLTLLLVGCPPDVDVEAVEQFLDVHHRGRSRVFRDEYVEHADAATGLPDGWMDEPLRDAVELVLDAHALISSTGGTASDQVSRLFAATVATTTRLGRQQILLDQRSGGARWKSEIHAADLALLTEGVEGSSRAREALFSPCRHYVQQLEECGRRTSELNQRAGELFAVVSAMADRALLERTEGARRAAIVVGVLTACLAVAGVYAAVAAIPLPEERSITPTLRAVSLVGSIVVAASLTGLLVAAVALRRRVEETPEVVLRLVERVTPSATRTAHWPEVLLASAALVVFTVSSVLPNVWLLVVAAGCSGAALVSYLVRHGDR